MDGVPEEVIDEKLQKKAQQKIAKFEAELKKQGININNPSFDISHFDVPNPRPPKMPTYDANYYPPHAPPHAQPHGPPHGVPPPGAMPIYPAQGIP